MQCAKILKMDVEDRPIVITLMKEDSELHQLSIEASEN